MEVVRQAEMLNKPQAVIFCNTAAGIADIEKMMEYNRWTFSAMHGDMEQKERDMIMREFRSKFSRYLVCGDEAARRAAATNTSLVINYDLPADPVCYFLPFANSR